MVQHGDVLAACVAQGLICGRGDTTVLRIAGDEDAIVPGSDPLERPERCDVRRAVVNNPKFPVGIGLYNHRAHGSFQINRQRVVGWHEHG